MSIDDGFKKMLAGVKQADEGRDEVMAGLEAAWKGRKDLGAQMEELREAVATLQAIVLGQTVAELRTALRAGRQSD